MQVLGHEIQLISKNASGEYTLLSCDGKQCKGSELPADVRQWFQEQPRLRVRSNGSPYIKFDGQEVLLGYWACDKEGLDKYKESRVNSGSGVPKAKVSERDKECREALVEFKGTLPEELQKEMQSIISKFFPSEEEIAEQKKMDAARALLASLSEEQKKLLGL